MQPHASYKNRVIRHKLTENERQMTNPSTSSGQAFGRLSLVFGYHNPVFRQTIPFMTLFPLAIYALAH